MSLDELDNDPTRFWVASTEATHSRNLATRPHGSSVVVDSQAPVDTDQAGSMAAVAEELTDVALGRGIAIYNGRLSISGPAERLSCVPASSPRSGGDP